MERYSGSRSMEAMPVGEWAAPGGEIGLEEPMWQLGLGGGHDSYPERPDDPDCIYYLRTGFCGYGNRCRFNHPRDRNSAMRSLRTGGVDHPERIGQPVCQYYMRTGLCKFGGSCKYHHPKYGVGSSAPITLNFYGYPLKPGERQCSHYIKTGHCKFGLTCKFHHPQPDGIQPPAPRPGLPAPAPMPTHTLYPTVQSPSLQSSQQYRLVPGNWPIPRPAIHPGSYVPGSYGPMIFPPGVVPVPGWAPYPAPVNPMASPNAQPTVGAGPVYGITQLSSSPNAYTEPYVSITSSSAGPSSSSHREHVFPERPGQPECQFYLRTGECKFGPTCKYHHPREWSAPRTIFSLNPMGLPLRPGAPLCSHYAQSGACRYGLSCNFDHPIGTLSYSPSASSLTDMPVAPYPVGSTSATLVPSSSSSDLRPELQSGPVKDTFSSHMMSAMNSSSTSVGVIYSKGGPLPAPQSNVQHSRPGSPSSSLHSSSVHFE